jgi:hypothetical protein
LNLACAQSKENPERSGEPGGLVLLYTISFAGQPSFLPWLISRPNGRPFHPSQPLEMGRFPGRDATHPTSLGAAWMTTAIAGGAFVVAKSTVIPSERGGPTFPLAGMAFHGASEAQGSLRETHICLGHKQLAQFISMRNSGEDDDRESWESHATGKVRKMSSPQDGEMIVRDEEDNVDDVDREWIRDEALAARRKVLCAVNLQSASELGADPTSTVQVKGLGPENTISKT